MTDGPFVAGTDDPTGHQSDGLEPRWWWWAGLIGLILGWLVGLNVKPDVEDLHQAALDLVPPSAEVTEEEVLDKVWVLFTPAPPLVNLYLISTSTPEQLAQEIATQAEQSGWPDGKYSEGPGAITVRFGTQLVQGRASVRKFSDPNPETDYDAVIAVKGREGIGKIVTASASLTAGVLVAIVIRLLSHRRHGEPRIPLHTPLRWWHLLGVAFIAVIWRASLHFIV
jgi:hypothetical protein